jgi:acyl carrier protein phosphodiesterase
MNYLAHLYLADGNDDSLVGNILGDFVSGEYWRSYGEEVSRGIWTHREVDKFTDSHPIFLRSRNRIDAEFGLLRGVMIDVFYDHFLARNWSDYSTEPLEDFCDNAYRALSSHGKTLPPRLQKILPYMIENNWLVSYREKETMARVLAGLGRRLSIENRLAEGYSELERHYNSLNFDFREFFPEVIRYVEELSWEDHAKLPGSSNTVEQRP